MSMYFRNFVLCIACPALLLLTTAASPAVPDGQALFEKRCGACHKLPDPAQPPDVGWERQLEIMAPLARLQGGQKQDVIDYLLSHTRDASMDAALEEDRLLFEEKCSRCHSLERVLLSRLDEDELRHVVVRMQNRSGTDWISDDDVERVLAYLEQAPSAFTPPMDVPDDASPEQIFAVRCSACHTLERVFLSMDESKPSAEFWSHTISRMRGKAPQWMSESEANKVIEYLQSIDSATP